MCMMLLPNNYKIKSIMFRNTHNIENKIEKYTEHKSNS